VKKRATTPSSLESTRARALRLLAARPRSIAELRSRLRERAAEPAHVETVLDDMKRLGFLDDRSFATNRARSLLAGGRLGPRGVVSRLRAKGVNGDTAEKAMKEAMGDTSEDSLAIRALGGRPHGPKATEKENARAARFLLSRGFSGSTVTRVLRLDTEVDFSES
jgi:regulatory protein